MMSRSVFSAMVRGTFRRRFALRLGVWVMAENGSGNGLSSFSGLLDETGEVSQEAYNKLLGDAIALRIALRFLLRTRVLDGRDAEQVADALGELQREFEHQWVGMPSVERQRSWAVTRYRSLTETMNEIIEALRAAGRRR